MVIPDFIYGYIRTRLTASEQREIYPPSGLSEEQLEELKDQLHECMPKNSIIVDLWDWDVHFEEYLSDDWYFEAAFGETDTLDVCAEELGDFFLEKVEEYGLDYDQYPDYNGFESWISEKSIEFIRSWRENVIRLFGQSRKSQRL